MLIAFWMLILLGMIGGVILKGYLLFTEVWK